MLNAEMLRIIVSCAILVIFTGHSAIHAEDSLNLPIQSILWEDGNVKKIINEIDVVKASNEVLKARLETIYALIEHHINDFKHIFGLEVKAKIDNQADTNGSQQSCKHGNSIKKFPSNCAEALKITDRSGIQTIQVESFKHEPFVVYCDGQQYGGNWTVIQRRKDGSVNFLRKWDDYKVGFGNLEGEFFIGLDKLHAMTTETPHELLIIMEDFKDEKKYAKYDSFAIGSEDEDYALNVLGSYSGDAGDSLRIQASQKFTTIDRDNDNKNSTNCAVEYKGAWWYNNCHESNLNGFYYKDGNVVNGWASGIHWHSWDGHSFSLKFVEMLIRPVTK